MQRSVLEIGRLFGNCDTLSLIHCKIDYAQDQVLEYTSNQQKDDHNTTDDRSSWNTISLCVSYTCVGVAFSGI